MANSSTLRGAGTYERRARPVRGDPLGSRGVSPSIPIPPHDRPLTGGSPFPAIGSYAFLSDCHTVRYTPGPMIPGTTWMTPAGGDGAPHGTTIGPWPAQPPHETPHTPPPTARD